MPRRHRFLRREPDVAPWCWYCAIVTSWLWPYEFYRIVGLTGFLGRVPCVARLSEFSFAHRVGLLFDK